MEMEGEDRLRQIVEKCWKYHCSAIKVGWFKTSDLFGRPIFFAYPAYQEVVGGKDDGQLVWTGFTFSVTELLDHDSVIAVSIKVLSNCNHCNPHPLLDIVSVFEDHEFNLIVLLEPKRNTEAVEILDIASQSVRLIEKETES